MHALCAPGMILICTCPELDIEAAHENNTCQAVQLKLPRGSRNSRLEAMWVHLPPALFKIKASRGYWRLNFLEDHHVRAMLVAFLE